MVKRKIKEEIKKPDILIATVESAIQLVRENLRLFIIAVAVFCLAGLSVFGYTIYAEKKNQKIQISLYEGIKSLETYDRTGNKEDLDRAEGIFQKIVKEKRGKAYVVAKLYLGTAYSQNGKTEEANKIYQELSKDSPTVAKMLSDQALQNASKK